ncbi:MAG: hypothetical protein V4659_11530 [Pseudomonadota bacterium]
MRKAIISALALATTAGVAADTPPPSRAAQAAMLLVAADHDAASAKRSKRQALARTLDLFERIGLRAELAEDAGVLKDWRVQAGASDRPVWRGRALGPAFRRGQLGPGQSVRIEQLFLAGQQATVAVAAAERQTVRLAVSGPGATPVCPSTAADCRWQPVFTQRYAIDLHNPGPRPARYYLVTD